MPRIEKMMLLVAGVAIAAGVVIGLGHRNDAEAKPPLTPEQLAALAPAKSEPPQTTLQVAPQPQPQTLASPAQVDGGSGPDQQDQEPEDGHGS